MATALDDRDFDGDLVKCTICLEQYSEPRKMPNCAHSFCKACIITYVSKMVKNESDREIPCPFCRVRNPAPKDKEGIPDWVKSLEVDEQILAKLQGGAVETQRKCVCDSCCAYGISTKASKLCIDCFELLCVPCSAGRHSGKSYKNHKVTYLDSDDGDTNEEADLEEFRLLKEYSVCTIHSEQIKFYCKEEECLCCPTCFVMRHRKCHDVAELQGSALENDAKADMVKMKNSIDKLSSFAKSIIEARQRTTKANKNQAEAITKTLQEIRSKINKLLDALEETSNEQAKAISKNISMTGEDELEALNAVINDLAVCLSLIEKTIKYGSARYLYAVFQNLKKKVRQYEATILDLCDAFENVVPALKIENMLQQFLDIGPNDTSKLATVVENHEEVHRPQYNEGDLLRNYNVTKSVEKSVNENYTGIDPPSYSDLMFLPNDSAVFVDEYNGYIYLTNKNYEVIASCNIMLYKARDNDYSKVPKSCTYTRDGKIAISAPSHRKLYILSADDQLNVVREISTKYKPQAIYGLQNGDIAVAWKEPVAFGIISDNETHAEKVYFCEDKSGRRMNSFQYMAVDETRKHVIQPCFADKAVYCFDFDGYPKFKYTSTSLTSSKGVALDGDGNIYICSYGNGSLHVVSPTGRPIRIIKEGCPVSPIAIAFKKNREEFAITNGFFNGRSVIFFKLQKQ